MSTGDIDQDARIIVLSELESATDAAHLAAYLARERATEATDVDAARMFGDMAAAADARAHHYEAAARAVRGSESTPSSATGARRAA